MAVGISIITIQQVLLVHGGGVGMGRKGLLSVLVALLASFFFLVSCNPEISAVMGYPTPTIKGRITVPASSGLLAEDIWLKVVDGTETKYVGKVKSDGTFEVGGLEAAKQYSILFSSEEPDHGNVSKEAAPKAAGSGGGYGGWLTNVTAAINEGNDVGSVKMKPLGTITGVVKQKGAESNYDATVYIPGSSFIAMTDGDGNFSMFSVPQGTHTIRYTADGYVSVMKEGALLHSESETENPVLTLAEVELVRNVGEVQGIAMLSGAADHAGITVKLEGEATSVEGSTSSNGDFRITNIPPGTYKAVISFPGYLTQTVGDVKVVTANTTTMAERTLVTNGGRITGKVKLNDGAGAEGVIVVARSSDGKFSYTGSTEAGGEYSLDNCYPGTYSVTISKAGYASHVESGVVSSAGNTTTIAEIVLSSSFGSVSGVVKDSRGNPLAHVQVNIGDFTAFTNSEGYFIKSDLPLGQYAIALSKDGYTTKTLALKVSIESNKAATIGEQMLTSIYGSIHGTIALNDGKSPEGATVSAASADGSNRYPAAAASDGTYSISNVLPATYTLSVIKEGYATGAKTISVTADYTTAAGTITLESLYGSLKVLVNYADKDPDDKITVSIRNGESSIRTATTSNSSTLILDDIPVGTGYVVTASALGYSSSEKTSVSVISNTETTVQLDDLSNRYGSVSGTVQTNAGTSLAGAIVLIKGTSEYTATTDENGSFSKDGIGIGSYEVTISKDGYGTLKLATAVSVESSKATSIGTQKLISIYGSIAGKVMLNDASTSEGITVTATIIDGDTTKSSSTNSEGYFNLSSLIPGNYALVLSKAGYAPQTIPSIKVTADAEMIVDEAILSSLQGKAAGRILLSNTNDRSGIAVLLKGAKNYQSITSSDGTYQFSGVDVGYYSVEISKLGYSSQTVASMYIESGKTTLLDDITLIYSSSSITGRISLEGTPNYGGVTVTAISTVDGSVRYSTTTAEDGTYYLNAVPAGEYSIEAQAQGYLTDRSIKIILDIGVVKTVEPITLKSVTSTVKGTVSLDGALNHTGISILLKATDADDSYSTTTDQSGAFTLTRVNPGLYELYASKDGYQSIHATGIVVESSTTKTLDSMNLEIAIKSMTGTIRLELRDNHAGTLVTATNLSDDSLVYSAITNSNGVFSLAGMQSGEYLVTVSSSGYNTLTLPTIQTTTTVVDLGTIDLAISRGKISGQIKLEGWTHHDGITVRLVGTDYAAVTDAEGIFELNVPTGNYPGGLMLSKTDFETRYLTDTLTVISGSTFAIKDKDVTLKATHATVSGSFDVRGMEDDSSIEVKLGEHTATTGPDGSWRFEHVRLGTYTLEATYENVPDFRTSIAVTPAEEVNTGTIILIPQTASIKGLVRLKGMGSSAGINVEVTTSTLPGETLRTITDGNGQYYLSGLSTAGEAVHTVTFTKAGWDSQNITVSSLVPLEVRDITTSNPIELVDTTPPILNSVSINDGGNTTSDPTVTLKIDAVEQGSGIKRMRISWDGTFDTESWIGYSSIFDSTIANSSNGEKTVHVQIEDTAGNQATTTVTATIILTDQVKAVSGILEPGELHWMKADSPILVAGDVIVNTGDTLVIDPGVDVQFNGPYAISIRGTLTAIGIPEEPIVFKPAVDQGYTGKWNGITAGSNTLNVKEDKYAYTLVEGSIIQHARILNTEKGVRGNLLLKDSTIETNGYALGESSQNEKFVGYAIGNTIIGSVSFGGTFFNNRLDGNGGMAYAYPGSDWSTQKLRIINNLISDYSELYLYYLERFDFNTLQDISNVYPYYGVWELKSKPSNNIFSGIEQTILLESHESVFRDMIFSNIYNNLGSPEIKLNTSWSTLSSHNWRYNYWGEAHTAELMALQSSNKKNASFIHDAYDNPDVTMLDYSGFVTEPWEFAGYQGDGFIDFSVSFLSKAISGYPEATIGQPIEFSLEMLTGPTVSKYRMGQSIEQLKSSDWKTFSGVASLTTVDTTLLRDGFVDLIVQVMDGEGNISALKTLSVGYEVPKFVDINIADGTRYTTDTPMSIKTKITDNVYAYGYRVWLDDLLVVDNSGWGFGTDHTKTDSYEVKTVQNGDHILTFEVVDMAGNTTTTTRSIVVDRPVPIASNINFTSGSTVAEGSSLDFTVDISQAYHLKTLRVLSNGNEMKKISYVDNGEAAFTYDASIASVYLPNGENTLSVELTDYAGNVATYELGEFTVGGVGTGPTITNVSIADGTVFDSITDTNLTFTASDSGGVRLVRVLLNGEEVRQFPALAYNDTLKTRSIDMPMNIPWRKNGTYTLTIEATDFAGYKTTDERSITIDRAIPTASFTMSGSDLYDDDTFTVSYNIQNAQSLAYFELLVDGHQLKYQGYYGLDKYRSTTSSSWTWDVENLPAGTHGVTMRVVDIAGNISETASQQITVNRTVHSSDYGLGLTWDADGTLLRDWSTHYLWNFDDPAARGLDAAGGVLNGNVEQTTEGLGGTAARFSIGQSVETEFPDASWTVEYWGKMENVSTYSYMQIELANVMQSNVLKYSSTTSSGSSSYYTYMPPGGVELSQDSIYEQSSREARGKWHHYAWVSIGNELYFYIDGLLMGKLEDKMSNVVASSVNIYGYENNYMDEIRISMRARSVDELWNYVQYAKDFLPND